MKTKKPIRSWKHLCNLFRSRIVFNEYTNEILSVDDAIHSVIYVARDCDEFIETGEYTQRQIFDSLSREHKYFA